MKIVSWQVEAGKLKLDPLFDRIDGKTVKLNVQTYTKLLEVAKLQLLPPIGGETTVPILPIITAYYILYKLGWTTKKLPKSDKFTAALVSAWQVSSKSRKLDPKISKYKEDMISAAPATIRKLSADAAAVKAKSGEPTGAVTIFVSEMQDIVHALGVPRDKATTDKSFGPATLKAWEKVASARNLNAGVTGKKGDKQVKVPPETYNTLKAEAAKGGKVSPLDSEVILVITVQQGLNVLAKSKLGEDGTWGSKTESALRAWLNKQPGGKTVKPVIVTKTKGSSSIRLPRALVGVLRSAAKTAPAPQPKNEDERKAADAVVQASTQSVSVLLLQHALSMLNRANANRPAVSFTGTWDPVTQDAFLLDFKGGLSAILQRIWRIALPRLVSTDSRTIKLPPADVQLVGQGESLWQSQQQPPINDQQKKEQEQQRQQYEQQTQQGGGSTVPDGGAGGGTIPNGGAELPSGETPGGGGAPTPSTSAPEAVWDAVVAALGSMGTQGVQIAQAVSEKQTAREHLLPEVSEAFDAWCKAAEKIKLSVAQMIEGDSKVMSAIDASAGSAAPAAGGVSEWALAAYFGELAGPAADILLTLKTPLATETAVSGYGLGELEQVAQAAQIAGRLGGAAWAKMIELLSLPVVRAAAVTYIGVKGVGEAFNADATNYKDLMGRLYDAVEKKQLTVEDAGKLKPSQPMGIAAIAAIGVVVLGGFALYLRGKR